MKQGFSLIEILMSLLVLSCVLLGFDATALYALQVTQTSHDLHVATLQMDEITERLKALEVFNGLERQIALWNGHNKEVLPAGRGVVTGHFPLYHLTLSWKNTCIHELNQDINIQKNHRPYADRSSD